MSICWCLLFLNILLRYQLRNYLAAFNYILVWVLQVLYKFTYNFSQQLNSFKMFTLRLETQLKD